MMTVLPIPNTLSNVLRTCAWCRYSGHGYGHMLGVLDRNSLPLVFSIALSWWETIKQCSGYQQCVPVYKEGVLGGIAGPSGDIRLVKFMSKIKDPSRMTCKGLVLLLKVFVPLPSLTHLNGLPRPLRVPFTLFSRTSTTIHHLTPDKHLVSVLVGAYKHLWRSSYVPVECHYHTWVDSNESKTE